jgi:hypothetical protein
MGVDSCTLQIIERWGKLPITEQETAFMPNKPIRWAARHKDMLACLLVFLMAVQAHATSIVVLVTEHDIVIGADGKLILTNPRNKLQPPSVSSGTKLVLIGGRIAVAQCGIERIGNGEVTAYSFTSLMEYLQSNSSPTMTVTELVEMMKQRLSHVFVGFDSLLKSGVLKREDLPPPGDVFLKFYVAGYENGHPSVFVVNLAIDWNALHLEDPAEHALYPVSGRKNLALIWTGGSEHGIIDLLKNPKAPIISKAIHEMPLEYRAVIVDHDLTGSQLLHLERSLLDVEVQSNPDTVGYPLTVVAMQPTGVEQFQYSSANP